MSQDGLPGAKTSRKIFDQIREDYSSLFALYDSDSFISKGTDTTKATSKLSLNFDFDAELLQHKIYKGVFRSLMRKTKAPALPPPVKPLTSSDHRGMPNEFKILALGPQVYDLVWSLMPSQSTDYDEHKRITVQNAICHAIGVELAAEHERIARSGASVICHGEDLQFPTMREFNNSSPAPGAAEQMKRCASSNFKHLTNSSLY